MDTDHLPQLMTCQEVADELRVSRRTIYRLVAAGHLKAIDISMGTSHGRDLRIHSDDLSDYLTLCNTRA